MSTAVHQRSVRDKLTPRREPYWGAPLEAGRYLGFRKLNHEVGTWVARARDPDTGRQRYRGIGQCSAALDYAAALKAARTWFAALDAGVTHSEKFTVADACREYIEELTRAGREKTAADARWRFTRGALFAGSGLGATDLARLRTPALKKWRDSLMARDEAGRQMTPAGVNRMLTALRAALNLAVQNRRVAASAAVEWGAVKQFRGVDGRREIFLDVHQRRALLEAATGDLRDLLEAAALTGARPGELVSATRAAFDSRTGTLKLSGKTGTRVIPLSAPAVELFARLAKSKLPGALLIARDSGAAWTRIEWSRQIRAAAAAARVRDANGREVPLPAGVCLYSLRHSYISEAIVGGMTTLDVARLCGTSLQMIEKNYGHIADAGVRERLGRVRML